MKRLLIIAGIIVLAGCEPSQPKEVIIQKFKIVKVYQKKPVSIHDEISPKWRAVLSNGDTVVCGSNSQVGDSITYEFIIDARK